MDDFEKIKVPSVSKNIPPWMTEKNKAEKETSKKSSIHFLRKTIKTITNVFQNEVFDEKYARARGMLQSIDARVKLIIFLAYIIYCGLTQNIISLIFLSFIALIYAKFSRLSIKSFVVRVWLILPVIIFILSIPAATNFIISGTPLFYIYKAQQISFLGVHLPSNLYFSVQGIYVIFKTAIRVGASFSFGYLLVMTTRWSSLSGALSVLRVPKLIISILNMTYRYIFLLSKISLQMFEARFLRTVGEINNKSNRDFISNRMSFLLIKASYLSDEIYSAMRCRCYTGEYSTLTPPKINKIDKLWIFNNLVIVLIVVIGEILF
jgi:cobalt/nickel transport system permease protein